MAVGKSPDRLDGRGKVTGEARYVDDIETPEMLHGVTVRSTTAHGRYLGYELDPTFDWQGIHFADHEDIVGSNYVALIVDDQPALVSDVIRHWGEPVLLVAAETRERAVAARAHVTLKVAPLPPVFDPEQSRAGAGPVWGDDNIISHLEIAKGYGAGCVDRVLAEQPDALLVEGRYETGWQEQMYIEPQGVIARPWGAGVEVEGSLQCPHYVVKALAQLFQLKPEQVRVIQAVTGGGFGGKEDYPSILSCHAGLLSRKTGRAVKMIYDRCEDLEATTRRHPSVITMRTAVSPTGELLALESDCLLDGGAYTTLSTVVLSRALIHGVGPYRCAHAHVAGDVVATNMPPNGAFRGFGAPQICFATERHMDRVARRVGRDPVSLRRELALQLGDTTLTGQTLKSSVASDEVLDKALAAAAWTERRAAAERINASGGEGPMRTVAGQGTAPRLRGVGMSFFFHGAGFTGNGEARIRGRVRAELGTDGVVTLFSGSTDIGQGTRTIFPQIAAEVLGLPIESVRLWEPDTAAVPDSGPTVASRTCMVVGKVVEDCARHLRGEVLGPDSVGPQDVVTWNRAVSDYLAGGGEASVELEYRTDDSVQWDNATYQGEAYPCYAWACDVVEVEVDPDTMEVGIVGFWSAQDVGKAIHPVLVQGQLEGGSLQALGYATVEEMIFDGGALRNNRMTNYIIPTALDAPEMDIRLVENPFEGGPFGAKGIGELPMDGGAPAVLAAIEHATGLSLDSLPASPEKLMRAAAQGERS